MKITIVIEDGNVTTSQDDGPSQSTKQDSTEIRPQDVHDAGAAPSTIEEESTLLGEEDALIAEPQYSTPATVALDGDDGGAAPVFDAEEEELVEEEAEPVEEEAEPVEEEEEPVEGEAEPG